MDLDVTNRPDMDVTNQPTTNATSQPTKPADMEATIRVNAPQAAQLVLLTSPSDQALRCRLVTMMSSVMATSC